MKSIEYMELGGTLFVPASHKHLQAIVNEGKFTGLKSVVIDFEDGLEKEVFESAQKNFLTLLKKINKTSLFVFVRARDVRHLQALLQMDDINKIDGFVLAKFSLLNAESYFELLAHTDHYIMPSIEGEELFNHNKLHLLKEKILANKQRILLVRFGLEDMLKQLAMRRKCYESIFDFSSTSSVVGNFIAIFKSSGFAISGGVYPCFKDEEGFRKDVKRDLKEGLFTKTIIHPNQIKIINELYRVSQEEYSEAKEIEMSQKVLFSLNDKMVESVTMLPHSQSILFRSKIYGKIE
jgi:citrate lyase beta subunit